MVLEVCYCSYHYGVDFSEDLSGYCDHDGGDVLNHELRIPFLIEICFEQEEHENNFGHQCEIGCVEDDCE